MLRECSPMTKYAQPRMPARMDLVITALGGNAARIAILGALVQHPLSTPGDLAGHTGLSVNTIRKHLAVLLTAGLIESDPPSSLPFSERNGQRARYSVVRTVLDKAYDELGAALGIRHRAPRARH